MRAAAGVAQGAGVLRARSALRPSAPDLVGKVVLARLAAHRVSRGRRLGPPGPPFPSTHAPARSAPCCPLPHRRSADSTALFVAQCHEPRQTGEVGNASNRREWPFHGPRSVAQQPLPPAAIAARLPAGIRGLCCCAGAVRAAPPRRCGRPLRSATQSSRRSCGAARQRPPFDAWQRQGAARGRACARPGADL